MDTVPLMSLKASTIILNGMQAPKEACGVHGGGGLTWESLARLKMRHTAVLEWVWKDGGSRETVGCRLRNSGKRIHLM